MEQVLGSHLGLVIPLVEALGYSVGLVSCMGQMGLVLGQYLSPVVGLVCWGLAVRILVLGLAQWA